LEKLKEDKASLKQDIEAVEIKLNTKNLEVTAIEKKL